MFSIRPDRRLLVVVVVLLLIPAALTSAQAPGTLTIGVIGKPDSPTAYGVELALRQFNSQGNAVMPDGKPFRLALQTQDATTPDGVTQAISTLKTANAIAIFGPDDNSLALASADALLGTGLPVFTAAQSNALQPHDLLFRTRTDYSRLLSDLADYLTKDLAKTRIALYQGDPTQAERIQAISAALTQANNKPITTVVQTPDGKIGDSAKVLMDAQPDIIAAFGSDMQVSTLLQSLRSQGYSGPFSYPDADDSNFIQSLPDNLQVGIVGVTNWVYSTQTTSSGQFVQTYVSLFGTLPTASSAAAYDAANALFLALPRAGIDPQAIGRALRALPKTPSIQGAYNPSVGGNALSANGMVFSTGEFGAPLANAAYDETGRVPLEAPTPTLTPSPTSLPTATPTPNGVTATATGNTNVRSGPALMYPIIGMMLTGQSVRVYGVSPDGLWLVIAFGRGQGWVNATRYAISGNLRSVPILRPPPTPTPIPPTPIPYPNVRVITAAISPSPVIQKKPFTFTAVIKNLGGVRAGQFAVAASFIPGNAYSAAIVGGLNPGQSAKITLHGVVAGGSGTFTVAIVVDLNNQLNEGPYSIYKQFPFTYQVK